MLLIFGDDRLGRGNFKNLVSKRSGIDARQLAFASSALAGPKRQDVVALIGGNQQSHVARVAGLGSLLFGFLARSRFWFLRHRFGMRVLRAGWQRRILWGGRRILQSRCFNLFGQQGDLFGQRGILFPEQSIFGCKLPKLPFQLVDTFFIAANQLMNEGPNLGRKLVINLLRNFRVSFEHALSIGK